MYKNIFNDVKSNTKLSKYEELFTTQTNNNYKDYLYDQYINKGLSSYQIATHLGVKAITITTHLKSYNIKKSDIVKEPSSDLFNQTPGQLDKELNGKLYETYQELIKQGYSQSQIAAKFKIKYISALGNWIKNYEEKLKPKDDSKLIIKGLKGKKPIRVDEEFREHLGMSYEEFLKQKYIDEKLSIKEISEMIGISVRRINDHIKNFGLSKSQSEARKEALEMGRIDQTKVNKKARISRIKSISRSNKQDLLRELIKHHLELILNDYPNIEIVTGYNEYCVLNKLEIDIPIIIFYQDKTYKIAIEYDGDVWHKNRETDSEKENLLTHKQWYLIRVEENKSNSSNLGEVEEKAKYIINQIKSIIYNS